MVARKAISKKTRFEVFKRDKFTCQYCGKSAPDVILEIDHLHPVSKGGGNEILNLVTACKDCNRGKSNRTIDDNSTIMVQKKQLDELQERREQLKLMMEWKRELQDEEEIEVDCICSLFHRYTKWEVSDCGRFNLKSLINRFGFSEVYTSTELSIERYYNGQAKSWDEAFNKIGGICYNRKKQMLKDARQIS